MGDLLQQARTFDPSKAKPRTTSWAPLQEHKTGTPHEHPHPPVEEEVEVQESGHTDVASAMTNVKVAMSALTKMSGELAKLNPEDSLPSWWTNKVAVAVDKLDGMADYLDTQVEEVELDEAKYDLYHKDFSSAMQHAYAMAKKLHGVTIDPKEIDDKVATGPKKPSKGKTNSYRLKGKGGAIQVQVANLDDKKFELNMYKEEVNPHMEVFANHIAKSEGARDDARRAMKRDPDMKSKGDTADDDATQKDVDNAAKNIIMQLRKSVSMRGQKDVEFADIGHGYKKKVPAAIASKALDMYNKMKPQEKMKFQTTIAKSYKDLLNAIKGK